MKNNNQLYEYLLWFNTFGEQLNSVYDKIGIMMRNEFKMNEVPKRYVNYNQIRPFFPTIFWTAYREKYFSIEILTNLGPELIKYKELDVPSINVFYCNPYIQGDNILALFNQIDHRIKKDKNGFFNGTAETINGKIPFTAFQVPLEKLDGQNADDVIMIEIIDRLKMLLSK